MHERMRRVHSYVCGTCTVMHECMHAPVALVDTAVAICSSMCTCTCAACY